MKVDNPDRYPDVEDRENRLAKWRTEFETFCPPQHKEIREDMGFRHGHQWSTKDKKIMDGTLDVGEVRAPRPMVTFNRIPALINSVYGAMVHNQMGIGYVRRVPTPMDTAEGVAKDEILSAAAEYFRNMPCWGAEYEDADMFLDMLTCGIGCQQLVVDTEITGQPEIVGRRINPLHMGWDTRAKQVALRDRRWNFYKTRLSADEVKDEFGALPDKTTDGSGESIPTHDDSDDRPGIESDDGYRIYHWQWFESEKFFKVVVVDPQTGQPQETDILQKDIGKLTEGQDFAYLNGDKTVRRRRVYWEAFTHDNNILRINKIQVNAFTYEFAVGQRDDTTGCWYGVVRDAKDPQKWANKFLSLFMWIIATSGKGIMAEEGVFDSTQGAERDWSNPAVITTVAAGAISMNRIMPKPEAKLPPGAADILQFSTAAVREVTGISLEMIAGQMNDQAGVVEESRKSAAMAVVAWAFKSFRAYYHRHGHLLLRFMTEYIDRGRLIKTVDPSGKSMFQPFNYDDVVYEVEVDEVPNSPNKKAEVHAALIAYTPMVQQPDIPGKFKTAFMMELLRSSPLPSDAVRRLEESTQQKDPMAEQQAQIAMQSAVLDNQLKQAQAQLAAAMAAEKQASAETLGPKTQAGIEAQGSQALLNIAKARDLGSDTADKQAQSEIDIINNVMNAMIRLKSAKEMADVRMAEAEHRAMTGAMMKEHDLEMKLKEPTSGRD